MKTLLGTLVIFTTFSFLPATLLAQNPISLGNATTNIMGDEFQSRAFRPQAHKTIAGKVSTPKGEPVAHARVEISNNVGAPLHYLETDKDGEFQADYNFFDEEMGRVFVATLKITKKGFQVAHRITPMGGSINNLGMGITLRPVQKEDPNLLSQADLIKGIAPKLRQLGPTDGLSPKAEKDYARGVQEFLDRDHPDKAVVSFAKVVKLSPLCLKCQTMMALAELSWGDWDDPHRELVEAVNAIIKDPKLGSAEPLVAYGVLVNWDHQAYKSTAYFNEALKYAPHDALALQEMGRAQCQGLNWYAAAGTLKKALDAGAGPDARLMHAEALLWAATPSDAETELNLYLNGRDIKGMPPRVRAIWDNIQAGKKDQTIILAARAKAQARGEEPLDYLHHPPQNLPDFTPAADQAQMAAILAAVGKNVSQLFADLPNICSVEVVQQEMLNHNGKADSSRKNKYRYLALAPEHSWGPSIDEYRADSVGKESPQTGVSENAMLTEGFISAPLVFHPSYQSGSTFRLLGSQKVKGRNTFVIVYAQEPAKSSLAGSFQYGAIVRPTYTQGIAWVDAENYQIIRITSDLVAPLPQVRLDKRSMDITFTEVHFKQLKQNFWLPEAVTVTLDWNGRTYRNKHAYSDFLVSNVEATQKIGKPKDADKTVEQAPEPTPRNNPLKNKSLSLVPEAGKPPVN